MALSVSIKLVSSSARVTSVKSTKHDGRSDIRTPGLPGSDEKVFVQAVLVVKPLLLDVYVVVVLQKVGCWPPVWQLAIRRDR